MQPTDVDAFEIAGAVLGEDVSSVSRFPTGLQNFVYDVGLVSGSKVGTSSAGFVTRAGLDSISVEAGRFRPEDGRAIHGAGVAIRCHVPKPAKIEGLERYGRDIRGMVGAWVAEGVVDTLSGDDVSYLRALVDDYTPG